jgi:hypothetical protein
MYTLALIAGLAGAALIPSLASAQPQSCQQQHEQRVVGTIAGAGIGAAIGGLVAGHSQSGAGMLVGGVTGAVIGNQVTRPTADCAHAYGYYDSDGRWHATGAARADAQGYYDRDGVWVNGAPNGYYDTGGRWVSGDSRQQGYYDTRGDWVPAQVNGYYDTQGRWTVNSPNARDRGDNASYYQDSGHMYRGAADFRDSEASLDQRIHYSMNNGSLSQRDGRRALRMLDQIRNDEQSGLRYNGQLSDRDRNAIQARLDNLSNGLPGDDQNRRYRSY